MKRIILSIICLYSINVCAQSSWVAPEKAREIINPYEGNKIAAQKGAMLYQKLCWTCHGKTGQGDGPAGKSLKPKPKNFSMSEVQEQTDGELLENK